MDSFLFQIKCGNLIDKLKEMEHMFNFSKYDKYHVLYNNTRSNHLFYFKDEMKGQSAITDFIRLRPKCLRLRPRYISNQNIV